MVQIGRRGTARRLFENFKKFSKNTKFEFQNLVHHFLRMCLPCIVKKFNSIRTKLTEKIDFEVCHSGNFPPIVACSAAALEEMLRPHHSTDSDQRSTNWGHLDLGAQSGRKNQPDCLSLGQSVLLSLRFTSNLM